MLVSRKCVGTIGVMSGLPSVLTQFARSLSDLQAFTAQYVCGPDQYVHTIWSGHSFHTIARNEMAKQALGEFILYLDTDHAFAPDLLFRLVNAMRKYDADVVTGLYLMKSGPPLPTLWRLPDGKSPEQLAGWQKGEVLEVDCAGGGCLLVRNRVFDRIRDELHEEPFSTKEYPHVIGEDFAFFRRLRKLGIKAVCDTRIECHHLQVKPLRMWADYDPDASDLPTAPATGMKKRELEPA